MLVQFSRSVVSTHCDLMDCNTPGFPVHGQLPELSQTHVCHIDDAIQPSHSLLTPSPAFNLFQHQDLFQWVSSLHQVAKWSFTLSIRWPNGVSPSALALPMNIQDWLTWGLTGLISLQSKGLSRVFFNTMLQRHQFFSAQLSLWSNSHIHTWLCYTLLSQRQMFITFSFQSLLTVY